MGVMDWIDLAQDREAGACEYGNDPYGSTNCGEFLDWLINGQLLMRDCTPWSE
jgi:hypothetical protein